jgi:hypothetical protein
VKKLGLVFFGVFFLLLLGIPEKSFAYDSSPSMRVVLPETIWSAATGGGTWRTEIQVYTRVATSAVTLTVYFMDQATGGYRGPFYLSGPNLHNLSRWTNILSTLNSLDAGYDYYGKVGALWINVGTGQKISVQARNTHTGGYAKTFNGMDPDAAGNTGIVSPWRGLTIQGMYNGSVYRSAVVLFNASSSPISVRVALINSNDAWLGWEDFVMPGYAFRAFNPFARFGQTGVFTNTRIWVAPISGSGAGRIMAIGATANNTTNDPSAHIATQYD